MFRQMCADVNIPEQLYGCLCAHGYATAAALSYSIVSQAALEEVASTIIFEDGVDAALRIADRAALSTHPVMGALRRLYDSCWRMQEATRAPPEASGSQGAAPPASSPWNLGALEWAPEAPPPKLSEAQMLDMKKMFAANYPGELLSPQSCPGTRYWSTVYHQLQDSQFLKWIPWKELVSAEQDVQLRQRRGHGRGSDASVLGSLLGVSDAYPAPVLDSLPTTGHAIMELFAVRRNTFSLCGACHLASYKQYDNRFCNQLRQNLDSSLGLRAPSAAEAQEADKTLHAEIYRLVNEEQWSLDQALHELAVVRQDLSQLLQPRPALTPQPPAGRPTMAVDWYAKRGGQDLGGKASKGGAKGGAKGGDKRQAKPSAKWSGKQAGGGKGKGGGGSRDSSQHDRPSKKARLSDQWPHDSWAQYGKSKDGTESEFCMRFHLQTCSAPSCSYLHTCPVWKSDGTVCGGAHPARTCRHYAPS